MVEDDFPKTAVTTPFGLFEYPFLKLSLHIATQTLQRLMERVMKGLNLVVVYIDDILVVSSPKKNANHLP